MKRSVHFVGTYPLKSDEACMRAMLESAAPLLRSLPSEARRPIWIVEDIQLLSNHSDVEVVKAGDNRVYANMTHLRVRPGHTLNPDTIELTYHRYARENWRMFDKLRKQFGRPDLALQICLPGTLEIPLFAFGHPNPLNGFRYRKPFEIALQREVDAIWNDPAIGGPAGTNKHKQLVWQIEIPAEVGGLSKIPHSFAGLRHKLAANFFAKGVIRQIAGLPEGARVILHPCNGDLNHEAYTRPKSARLIASLMVAIIKRWPAGRVLEAIHFPLGAGDILPPTDPAYYAPLRTLAQRLPDNTRFIAGFVHERASDRIKRIHLI